MKPWQKIPTSVILASMRQRLADDRAATEYEALGEMHVLEETGQLAPMSFLALANHFGWSRNRLRGALATWGKLADSDHDHRSMFPSMSTSAKTQDAKNPKDTKDTNGTTQGQPKDNAGTTQGQRRPRYNANFRVSMDNAGTALGQSMDNAGTPSCARGSSGDVDRDLVEIQSTTSSIPLSLSATPTPPLSLPVPAPPADPEDDADLCPAELIPAPARSILPPLVLLPPGPVIVTRSEGEPEDLLALLNALRTELHPPVLRADPNRLQGLALTDTRRAALTRGWTALGKVARPAHERRALLRLGVLYAYLSDSLAAQGARSTTEPIDTLLRKNHLTNYCERGRTDAAALEARYAEILADPTGDSSDPFNPAKHRRRA